VRDPLIYVRRCAHLLPTGRRCEWQLEVDATYRDEAVAAAEDHATTAGHPLCAVCRRSLRDERSTCTRCVANVRTRLSTILRLYALLPIELGNLEAAHGGPASEEAPLSTVLVLLGPGSGSSSPDDLPTDPPSISGVLGSWEDRWRRNQRQPAAPGPATVLTAVNYLTLHAQWAADHDWLFPEFTRDCRRLQRALEQATATASDPDRAAVQCFDCRQDRLERRYLPPVPCRHVPRDGCDQGGRVDVWTCGACGREYTAAEYWLAVRAHLEARHG